MQINKFSDFSLRVLIHLAIEPEKTLSTREIAQRQHISISHLAKVSQWLATEGYVTATRGRGGGMVLAKPAKDISIGDVLRKAEAGSPLVECLSPQGSCAFSPACGLLPLLTGAQEAFFAHLDRFTLRDVINKNSGMQKLVTSLSAQENNASL